MPGSLTVISVVADWTCARGRVETFGGGGTQGARKDTDGAAVAPGAGVRDLRSVTADLRDVVVEGLQREQKQGTREAREDFVDLAFVDDLVVVALDLRAPRLSISGGAVQKTDAGGVRECRLGWSRWGS